MALSNNYNSISYKAKYIQPATVKKLDKNTQKYLPESLSLVELMPNDILDVIAVSETSRFWGNELFASNIAYDISLLYSNCPKKVMSKFYAITEQNKHFNTLDSGKILGIAEIKDTAPDAMELSYIQTRPDLIYSLKAAKYKGIGSALVDYFKNLNWVKKITLIARKTEATRHFYKKNGFIEVEPNKFEYKKD